MSDYEDAAVKATNALFWALKNMPSHVQMVPMKPLVKKVNVKHRKTGKVDHLPSGATSFEMERWGRVVLDVPEQIANELQLGPEHMPMFLVVRVSKDALERFDSPVVMPTEH